MEMIPPFKYRHRPPLPSTEDVALEAMSLDRRGIHVEARGNRAVPALERLIAEVAPSLGLNWVIAQVDGSFEYASHPEVAEPDPITKADARRLARLAREARISLVPMYNCLGHQSWGQRVGTLLRAHPEFNEAPDLDPSVGNLYCMGWCPNHPAINPLLFDLFDELLEAFEPKALHVGMDEVFMIGRCERCKDTPPAELLAGAINEYYQHLVGRRGVEMQMWGDRLLPRSMGFSHWESSETDTEGAIDLIPEDILICDWHYHLMQDYPSVRYFQERGFRVWPAGWKEAPAVRRLIEISRRNATPNMVGYLCTTWCGVGDIVAALAGDQVPSNPDWIPDVVSGVKLGAALSQS